MKVNFIALVCCRSMHEAPRQTIVADRVETDIASPDTIKGMFYVSLQLATPMNVAISIS